MRRIAFTVVLAVAVSFLPSGCSSGPSSTEAAIRRDMEASLEALNTADVEGMRTYVSGRCRAKMTDDERTANAKIVHEMFGKVHLERVIVSDLSSDKTRAHVKVTTGIDSVDRSSTGAWWVLEDGTWRSDKC